MPHSAHRPRGCAAGSAQLRERHPASPRAGCDWMGCLPACTWLAPARLEPEVGWPGSVMQAAVHPSGSTVSARCALLGAAPRWLGLPKTQISRAPALVGGCASGSDRAPICAGPMARAAAAAAQAGAQPASVTPARQWGLSRGHADAGASCKVEDGAAAGSRHGERALAPRRAAPLPPDPAPQLIRLHQPAPLWARRGLPPGGPRLDVWRGQARLGQTPEGRHRSGGPGALLAPARVLSSKFLPVLDTGNRQTQLWSTAANMAMQRQLSAARAPPAGGSGSGLKAGASLAVPRPSAGAGRAPVRTARQVRLCRGRPALRHSLTGPLVPARA